LTHPNVVAVYDVGRDGNTPYLVMELVDGHSLATRMAGGPLSIPDAIAVALQICDALCVAHEAASCTATSNRRTSCLAAPER
jgi:serine/threonine-protein kinase